MKRYVIGIVFFCTLGWVYSDRAIGADAAIPASPAVPVTPSSPRSIFGGQAGTQGRSLDATAVKVGSFGQIDLHVKDQDLTRILQLLSIQAQRNIIVSKNVTGTVTADLYGVDFYQALDALLHANGYGYLEKGNFIYVYTAAELKQIQAAERHTIAKVVRLNYISAADASTFVTPLLSSAGAITLSGAVGAGFSPSTSDGGANTYAHADTMVIRDYPENVDQIMQVIKQLDVRPKQVLIEATVLESDLSENNAFGVNMTILASFGLSDFPSAALGPANTIANMVGGQITGNAQAVQWQNIVNSTDQSFRVGILNNNIAAFVDALDSVTDTTTLANPKLLVLNRQKASLLVGNKDGYLSTTQTQTSTTQTVDFLETGTKLTVRPFISDDGMIRMEVQPSISDGSVTQLGTTNVALPNESTEELTTNVMVHSGQTIILGGLFKEKTNVQRKQVPGVGDVPLLGAAFKGQSDTVDRNEYIFLITPTIVKDEALYAAGDRARDSADLARIGAREGLLPWSRSKLVSAHMRDAMDYYEKGEKNKALWAADMALTLDPTLIEARRLKDQITARRETPAYTGVLKDAIDVMVKKQLELDKKKPAPAPSPAAQPHAQAPATQPARLGTASAQPAPLSQAPATQPAAVSVAPPATQPAPAARVSVIPTPSAPQADSASAAPAPAAAAAPPSMQEVLAAGRTAVGQDPPATQPAASEQTVPITPVDDR